MKVSKETIVKGAMKINYFDVQQELKMCEKQMQSEIDKSTHRIDTNCLTASDEHQTVQSAGRVRQQSSSLEHVLAVSPQRARLEN